MKGRALTQGEKRAVVERVLAAWLQSPHERLGQFIMNALPATSAPLFYVEDFTLAEMCEAHVKGK